MKKIMRKTPCCLSSRLWLPLLLLLLSVGLPIQLAAQQMQESKEIVSDYEIQQNFKNTYDNIEQSLQQADTSAVIEKAIASIKKLENDYKDHAELLNKVLYPQTFEQEVDKLKKSALNKQDYLVTIEQQEQKLNALTGTVNSYDIRIAKLSAKTDSLRKAMQQSVNNEKRLSSLVRSYRQELEKRDNLILSFVDSVMIAYRQMDYGSMKDLEKVKKKARFNANGNALKMIRGIVEENMELLASKPDLTTEEYLRMNAVQHEFSGMWKKLGSEIVDIYGKGEITNEQLGNKISEWGNEIDGKTWASLEKAFDSTGITLPRFNSSESFATTLKSYIDESIRTVNKGNTENSYQNYKKFNSFWDDPVQSQWSSYLINSDILSAREMNQIDQHLEKWEKAYKQESNFLVYLLGASLLAVVTLGIFLAREKTAKSG